jgi:hypothetical protein
MESNELYIIEGVYEEALPEYYENGEKAIERFNELYAMYNKAVGHVLPTMYREIVVTRGEYWNPKTEEWEDE